MGARFQPALEILYADHMLNLGMLYFNSDRGLTVPDVLNPIIVAENPQILGYRLVDAAGTNFNRMFNFLKIETGNFARLQRHHDDLSCSFFLRQSSGRIRSSGMNHDKKKSGQLNEGRVSLCPLFQQSDCRGNNRTIWFRRDFRAAYIQASYDGAD